MMRGPHAEDPGKMDKFYYWYSTVDDCFSL